MLTQIITCTHLVLPSALISKDSFQKPIVKCYTNVLFRKDLMYRE